DFQGLPGCNCGGGRVIRPSEGGMVAVGVGQRWGEAADYPWQVRVILDGIDVEAHEDAGGVLIANIRSYMGGVVLWQNENRNNDNFDPYFFPCQYFSEYVAAAGIVEPAIGTIGSHEHGAVHNGAASIVTPKVLSFLINKYTESHS
nr:diacylglycerol kinase 1 [Tanacetum cinerariifolium]